MAAEAREAGAVILCATRFEGATRENGRIRLNGLDISARYLIGADGARSRVAEAFGLQQNTRFLTGLEVELEDGRQPRPALPALLRRIRALRPATSPGPRPAPTRSSSASPSADGAKPDLAAFMARTERTLRLEPHRRSSAAAAGSSRAAAPLPRTAAPGVLLIGDAAGWVSPMTGGGIRLAFKFGRRAASLVADHLLNGGAAPEIALARECRGSAPSARSAPRSTSPRPISRSTWRIALGPGAPHRRAALFSPPQRRRHRPRGLSQVDRVRKKRRLGLRLRFDSEGVDALGDLLGQAPRRSCRGSRPASCRANAGAGNLHAKMAFPAGPVAGVPLVQVGFIHHFQPVRPKSVG